MISATLVRAIEKAERQQAKSVGFAQRQLDKAEAAQKKTIAASERKVAAEQAEYNSAVRATRAARGLAEAAAELERKQSKSRNTLKALGDSYDRVTASLDKAKDKAAGLRDDRAQASSSIAGGLAGFGGGITGGNGLRMDAASIITGRTQNLADISAFGKNIDVLRKKGLNAKSIQEIADAGVDGGGQTAAALAGASKDQIKKLNSLDAQILKSAKKTGDAVGDSLYKPGIAAADGIVAGLASRQESIDKQMKKIGVSMADAMKKALGIKSPSTVMRDQVGVQVVDGIMVGMDSRAGALNAQLDGLVKVPPVTFSNPADGVFSSSGGGYAGSSVPRDVNVQIQLSGDGEVTEMFRQHARVIVDGRLVDTSRALVRAGGQG